jgi:O-antigen/teichoic acid export membrane protein
VAVGRSQIREAAKDYSRFPKYTLPASLLSATTLNGLPIAVGIAFGGAVLGVWSLAFRVLSAPLVIIGASISSVYYRRAVELRSSRSESLRLFKKTTLRLGLSSLPVFIVAAVFAPAIFSFSFGPEWAEAGRYFQVMAPWMWVRFSVTPVTMTTLIFDRNGVDFWIQLVLLAYVSICSGWAFIAGPDFLTFLSVLSLGLAAIYFSLILLYGKIAGSAHFD